MKIRPVETESFHVHGQILRGYQSLFALSRTRQKMYSIIILPVVLYGCETGSVTL